MDRNMSRARRRADSRRMKAKARRVRPWNPEVAATEADHLATCSGPCCGNPRRHFGTVTMQERRAPDWRGIEGYRD